MIPQLIILALGMIVLGINIAKYGYGKCKHLNKKEVYRDYPDAYIEYECLDCGEVIFEDMYNS